MSILDDLDLSAIADERLRTGPVLLLNLVEDLKCENAELRAEVQRLRDEINRIKRVIWAPKKASTSRSRSQMVVD